MKKVVFLQVLMLLSISTFASERIDRNLLLKQGIEAIKEADFEKVPQIIQQLRAQGAARQAQELEKRFNEARTKVGKRGSEDLIGEYQAAFERLQKDFDRLREENMTLGRDLDAIKKESKEKDEAIAGVTYRATEIQRELNEFRRDSETKLRERETEIIRLRTDLENCNTQLISGDASGVIAQLNQTVTRLRSEIDGWKDKVDEYTRDLAATGKKATEYKVQVDQLKNELSKAQQAADRAKKDADALRVRLDESLAEKLKLENSILAEKQKNQGLIAEVARLIQENDDLKAKAGAGAGQECIVLKRENEALRKSLDELKKGDIAGLKAELERCGNVVLEQTTKLAEFDQLKNTVDAQDKLIKSLQEELKSADETIKNLQDQLKK